MRTKMRPQRAQQPVAKRDDIDKATAGRWPEILQGLGVDGRYLVNVQGPCPRCHGSTKFRFVDQEGRGTFWCNDFVNKRGNGYGSGFQLVAHVFDVSDAQAIKMVRDYLGIDSGQQATQPVPKIAPPVNTPAPTPRPKVSREVLLDIWKNAKPLQEGDQVHQYLLERGISMTTLPKCIRFAPELSYMHTKTTETPVLDEQGNPVMVNGKPKLDVQQETIRGKFAAMVCAITTNENRIVGLHRTYLEGNQKAPVPAAKKVLGDFNGSAIRLGAPTEGILAVAEGVETALAYALFKGLPTWATVSTSGMKNFIPPEGISVLVIAGDNDINDAGSKAAQALKDRLAVERPEIRVELDINLSAGKDWLDEWNVHRMPQHSGLLDSIRKEAQKQQRLATQALAKNAPPSGSTPA